MSHPPSGLERIRTVIVDDHDELGRRVARRIAEVVRAKAAAGRRAVLGLATGSTPDRRLSGAGPPAPRGGAELRPRRHVQPRRVLPDGAGEPPLLPSVHAGEPLRPARHPAGEHPHPAGRRSPRPGGRGVHPLRGGDPRGRRHRPAAPRHRADRPHRLQRARLGRREPDPAHHARPGHPEGRRGGLLRRGERAARGDHDGRGHDPRGARDPDPRHRRAQGAHRAPRGRGRGGPRGRRDVSPAPPATTFYLDSAAGADLTRVATPWLLGARRVDHAARGRARSSGSRARRRRAILKLTQRDYAEHRLSSLVAAARHARRAQRPRLQRARRQDPGPLEAAARPAR